MTLPVPTQRTWSPGDVVTAAMMNANVRDAVNFMLGKPIFVGYQQGAQSIANSTSAAVSFDTTAVDTYSGHSNTTNNSRYTAAVAGWYEVSGQVVWNGSGTGKRVTTIAVNGSSVQSTELDPAVSTLHTVCAPARQVYLNVGDYVELWAYQTSGAALSTYATGVYQSTLSITWDHS